MECLEEGPLVAAAPVAVEPQFRNGEQAAVALSVTVEGLEEGSLVPGPRVVVQAGLAVAELPRRQCNAIWSPSHQCRLHLSHRRVKRLWLSANP